MNLSNIIITFVFTLCFWPSISGQRTTTDIITDQYWGLPMSNSRQMTDSIETDTLTLEKVADRRTVMVSPYLGGFKFFADGTFEELMLNCGEGRESYIGKWNLEADKIIVKIDSSFTWYFQILSMDENEIIAIYWIENDIRTTSKSTFAIGGFSYSDKALGFNKVHIFE